MGKRLVRGREPSNPNATCTPPSKNTVDATLVSPYAYPNNPIGQRVQVVNEGLAFTDAGDAMNLYAYNERGEVIEADRRWGSHPQQPGDPVAGQSFAYDAYGNIDQLLDPANPTKILAHYEYSPLSKTIVAPGDMAKANPFRFSTKSHEDEIGLVYYSSRRIARPRNLEMVPCWRMGV